MQFYRFELAFCGEPQGVGFIQGLEDIGLPIKKYGQLYDPFETLPCPEICDPNGPILFFFTKAGLQKYAPAIDAIGQTIRPKDWDLLGMVLEEGSFEHALYHDDFQAAWSRSYLEPKGDFYTIKTAEELKSLLPNV